MSSGKNQKTKFRSPSLLIKVYFLVGSVLIFIFFIIYANSLLLTFKEDAQVVPNLFARFFSFSTQENWESLMTQYVFDEVITRVEYPIILTDEKKEPLYWRNVGVREDVRYDDLDDEEKETVFRCLKKMEADSNMMSLRYQQNDNRVINYAFYGESQAMRKLRYMPYIEAGLVLFFVLFGMHAIFFFKRTERDILWIGMAKEMAHQLGTPISSLFGWLTVLKGRLQTCQVDDETLGYFNNMDNDVLQLKKIAQRFGKIGSEPNLIPSDLHSLLDESVEYYRRRLPHLKNNISLILVSKIQNVKVTVDPDLIKWAVENLIKNSIDAMYGKNGNISVVAVMDEEKAYIYVHDEGKGIPRSILGSLFEPGVSSKERGWGLGLSLTKRIIEEYHHGKISVIRTDPNDGTIIEISLPKG